ncbi:MAG: acyl-CoA synthetase [Rhodospirillales bacterium]|nr:acyl-CoA synthetase [Rhodospirillales bacterium]MCW8861159.1 acyl-CoA synthetase [Rhodospirillales bacterium]MCW8952244.1 acyl-CoA synthetase [Rhodospirillales bacterium]MCW8970800.1 acyl-CoA synthetase [Rhodospirillales bacterium]MCW9001468.1 acyl-CoA synthetase [Rhodospirillales bacterium]
MARKPAQRNQPVSDPNAKRFPWSQFMFVVMIALLMVVSLPTVALMFFGMLPTIVAYLIDRTPQKYATFCVGAMNFSGVFPYLMDLWMRSNSLATAMGMLTDVFTLVVIYGAAGFGWMLFNAIPPVVGVFLVSISGRRILALEEAQAELVKEWGQEVTGKTKSTPLSTGMMMDEENE